MKEVYLVPVPWVQLGDFQMRAPILDGETPSAWANLRMADAINFTGLILTEEKDFSLSHSDGNSVVHFHDLPFTHANNHTPWNQPMLDELLGETIYHVLSSNAYKIECFLRGESGIPNLAKVNGWGEYGQTCLIPIEFVRVKEVRRSFDNGNMTGAIDVGHHITVYGEQIIRIGKSYRLLDRGIILDQTVQGIANGILNADECLDYLDALKPSLPDLETAFWDAIPECDFKKPPPQVTFRP